MTDGRAGDHGGVRVEQVLSGVDPGPPAPRPAHGGAAALVAAAVLRPGGAP